MVVGLIFTGCQSASEPVFSDNPSTPPMTESMTNVAPSVESADAARFRAGETVTIVTSTGSDSDPGPIANQGQYLINDDGTITLPLIGPVQAVNKTPGDLQAEIEKLYVPKYYVRLTVTVTAQNRVYYVGGEVTKPGPEVYMGETTVTKAIQTAGDLTQFASHRIYLTRADGTRIRVNLDKALRDSSADPAVFPGDQIQVPRRIL